MRRTPLLLIICLLHHLGAASLPDDMSLDLTFADAINPSGVSGQGKALTVYLRRRQGRWQQGVGIAGRFNSCYHTCIVESASLASDSIELALSIELASDPWITGGFASYKVTLRQRDQLHYTGNYEGFFGIHKLKGRVEAKRHPAAKQWHPAIARGEHPRLLFRSQDLPALRKKAHTSFGKTALAQMTDAAGLAMQGLLLEDRTFFDKAKAQIQAIMARTSSGSKSVACRVWSWRLFEVALTYDLAYHYWDAEFRKEVEDYLARQALRHYFEHGTFTEYTSWSLTSRHAPNLLAGPAFAGLALWGEAGAAPEEPAAFMGGLDLTVPVAAVGKAHPSVPVNAFASGHMPAQWIYAGPSSTRLPIEKLKNLQPAVGQICVGDNKWQSMPEKAYWNKKISLTNANKHSYYSWNYLATTIDNDKSRWVRISSGMGGGIDQTDLIINGKPIPNDAILQLARGRHSLIVAAKIKETNPWGHIALAPQLYELSAEQAAKELTAAKRAHRHQLLRYQQESDFHQANGGASPRFQQVFEIGEALMYAIYRSAIGDGGFQIGARDSAFQLQSVMRYAHPYRQVFGRDVSPYPDITHYLPRKIFPMVFTKDGGYHVVPINGTADFRIDEWFEQRPSQAEFFAHLYPIVPKSYQPAVLWAWQRMVGTTPDDILTGFIGKGNEVPFHEYNTHAVVAFTTYPNGDMKPVQGQGLPKSWHSPGAGYVAFRNRFVDDKDFVVQCFANSQMSPDWRSENAGAVRINGLGHDWLIGAAGHDTARCNDSLLSIASKQKLNLKATGKVTQLFMPKAGGGSLSIDLQEIYASATYNDRGRSAPLYALYGNLRYPERFIDTGIRGSRSVAVDYSGRCGAPCLVAMIDVASGGGDKTWHYQLESRTEWYGKWSIVDAKGKKLAGKQIKKARIPGQARKHLRDGFTYVIHRGKDVAEAFQRTWTGKLQVADQSFTLHKGTGQDGATLRCRFAPSGDLQLQQISEAKIKKVLVGHGHDALRVGSHRIDGTGTDVYFCVMTIGPGTADAAPAVTVTGTGKDAVFTIGAVQVRYSDQGLQIQASDSTHLP